MSHSAKAWKFEHALLQKEERKNQLTPILASQAQYGAVYVLKFYNCTVLAKELIKTSPAVQGQLYIMRERYSW